MKREYPPFDVWLARKKKEHKLTNKEIAAACEVHPTAVGRWLKGERLPERAQVVSLSLLFKVSPMSILWMTDRKQLQELTATTATQSKAEILESAPELSDHIDRLWKMTPRRRAAFMDLARGDEETEQDREG